MSEQLYLFPEFAPVEKPKRTKSRKNSDVQVQEDKPAQDIVPFTVTREDLLTLPEGGFPKYETPHTFVSDKTGVPLLYFAPYVRRMAPIHTKAAEEWLIRFEALKKCLVEEYVRCHAAVEKKHPEWFINAKPVNPDVAYIMPFVFSFNTREEILYDYCSYNLSHTSHRLPLSLCADLVRKLNIHCPTFKKKVTKTTCSEDPVYQFAPDVKVEWISSCDTFLFHKGNLNDKLRTNSYDSNLDNLFPKKQTMPEDFYVLSRLYARYLETKEKGFDFRTNSDGYWIGLCATDKEQQQLEAKELEDALNAALDSWTDFRKDILTKILARAKANIAKEETDIMNLIGGNNVSQ